MDRELGRDLLPYHPQLGGADVLLDGFTVSSWSPIDAAFELADVIVPRPSRAASTDPFGLVQVGYTEDDPNAACAVNTQEDVCFSSYAYAGGLALVTD